VEEVVLLGADLLAGGRLLNNNCYAPAILRNPPIEAKLSCEEVFGPVLCLYEFDAVETAIAQANSLPYAFQAAVFTQDLDRALHIARCLDASAVMINDHSAFRVDWMPFAGLRQSGLGVGGIPYTLHEMSVEKLFVMHSPALP
jgi:acyl-CoA reductase-like NAD-dependent aldehyde dehydrogenase